MRLGILTAAALALTASAANASWTGCQVGAFGGLTATQTDGGVASPFLGGITASLESFGTDGGEVGLTVGCDLQVADRFIVGAFADYAFRDQEWALSGSAGATSFKLSTAYGDEWSVGVRAGVTVTPTTAVFMTAGYSEAEGGPIGLSINGTSVGSIDLGDYSGWFVGAQMETQVWKNIFLTADYRFHRYDTRTIDLAPLATVDLDTDAHTVRMALSFKFGASEVLQPMK